MARSVICYNFKLSRSQAGVRLFSRANGFILGWDVPEKLVWFSKYDGLDNEWFYLSVLLTETEFLWLVCI